MTAKQRVGFVIEQVLGHITHAANLRSVIEPDQTIDAAWCLVPWETEGIAARIPLYNSNWTVRSGVRARRMIRAAHRTAPLDALFVHTQVPAVLATDWLRKVPSVVSIDATPAQYDAMGDHYDHARGGSRSEQVKFAANKRCFDAATAMVAWSAWSKASLVADYGVPASKVTVIPPGVWFDELNKPSERADDGTVRILFVGGDLERKGGLQVLDAFGRLRQHFASQGTTIELHVVTRDTVPDQPGVHAHLGLKPNAPELLQLYRDADIFCLPTRADTLALVFCEAGAAGLPCVATAVGGVPEIVKQGETGLLVPPNDLDALTDALERLIADPDLRRRYGTAAASNVRENFDAGTNARRLVTLLRSVSSGASSG